MVKAFVGALAMTAVSAALSARTAPCQVSRSGGEQIIENPRPQLTGSRAWSVAPRPMLQIGSSAGDAASDFDRIQGAVVLGDGRIVVADGGDRELRVFDEVGRIVGRTGRGGSGPGEFDEIQALHLLLGDSLLVVTSVGTSLFSPAMQFVRMSISLAATPNYQTPLAVFGDGSFVGLDWGGTLPRPRNTGYWVDSVPLFRFDPTDPVARPIARVPLNAWNAGQYVRFGPIIRAVAANDRLFVGFPDKYEIDVYTASGQLAHRIRRPLQPMRVTQQVLDDLSRRANATSIERGEVVRAPRPAHADFFPAFDGLLADRTGNLWVQEYHWDATLPKQYAVFDTRGVWLTSVSMPPRFTPLFIDRDRVVGRWLDPDDVEYVRVYRIIKP